MTIKLSGSSLAVVLAVSVGWLAPGAMATDAAKGDLWETTSQMAMEGMPVQMPARTQKVCAAKDRTEPPGASDPQRNCTNSNVRTADAKVTWDVRCTGPDMTGVGEITYSGTDAYTGSIRFTAEQGPMTVRLSGRKLGECDDPK
jgi:hypothetical protein